LIKLVLFCITTFILLSCSHKVEQPSITINRYQLVVSPSFPGPHTYLIDTATGSVWNIKSASLDKGRMSVLEPIPRIATESEFLNIYKVSAR